MNEELSTALWYYKYAHDPLERNKVPDDVQSSAGVARPIAKGGSMTAVSSDECYAGRVPQARSRASGRGDDINARITEAVSKTASVTIWEKNDVAWVDDEWNEQRKTEVKKLLDADKVTVKSFWRDQYDAKADRYWDKFYKRNKTNFYKDRHYLHLEFPELQSCEETGRQMRLLEVGCGVGNAALPLVEYFPKLHVIAIDFAAHAIELLKERPAYTLGRCEAFVCDVTKDDLPEAVFKDGGVDLITCVFCLSAIAPGHMWLVASKLASALAPGGKLLIRDYGRFDQGQLRFKAGHKLGDNFYVRQDGTQVYYFTIDELQGHFEGAGLEMVSGGYLKRQYLNRQQGTPRFRVWVQATFRKKGN